MFTNNVAIIILSIALACCLYLLTVLARLRHIHHLSRAWAFIFLGLTLLTFECAIGIHLAYNHDLPLNIEQTAFLGIILVKALCYAIGFTIWKHDLGFYNARHKETTTMEDRDENTEHHHSDEPIGNPPQRPAQPPVPQPAPKPTPQDEPVPEPPPIPGDVPGPGR
jgi:hypothetical protein